MTHQSSHVAYTLSLHDALPISPCASQVTRASNTGTDSSSDPCTTSSGRGASADAEATARISRSSRAHASSEGGKLDRKSTRLNSSHVRISYAVFCLNNKMVALL